VKGGAVVKYFMVALLLGILISATGCSLLKPSADQGTVIEGKIVEVREPDKGIHGAILVNGDYWITITGETDIFKMDGKKKSDLEFQELKVDRKVKVIITGPIRESYPAQADAKSVEVLK
jgi:beta-N-acetylhexosaminidase